MTRTAQVEELRVLRFSSTLTILFSLAAVAVALLTDSETMTLEGMSGLVDVLVSLLAIYVVRKVHEPANSRYHFGYAKYEPLMIGVEGSLVATVCLTAIAYSVRDLMHPDPVDDPYLVIIYALASFAVSVAFGAYMKRVGRRTASHVVLAEGDLWVVEGWLSLGVFIAFLLAVGLSRTSTAEYSAYVDPIVCITLSVIFLRKPVEILRESFADLVDANPYAETVNIVEETAHACVQRYRLKGLQWVRVRKAGRRLFVMVSFLENPEESLEEQERVRQAVDAEMSRLNPDIDVSVLFRSGPAAPEASRDRR
jgi:cation diffusion facilitator family transporter